MAAVKEQNAYPKLSPADLKDPTLFRLQNCFDFLYSQVDKTQGDVATLTTSVQNITVTTTVPIVDLSYQKAYL